MLLLAVSIVVSLSIGSAGISVRDVWGIMLHQLPWLADKPIPYTPGEIAIVTQVRLSRVLLAVLVGACLALAGTGFQGVLRNPLADPYTLRRSLGLLGRRRIHYIVRAADCDWHVDDTACSLRYGNRYAAWRLLALAEQRRHAY